MEMLLFEAWEHQTIILEVESFIIHVSKPILVQKMT